MLDKYNNNSTNRTNILLLAKSKDPNKQVSYKYDDDKLGDRTYDAVCMYDRSCECDDGGHDDVHSYELQLDNELRDVDEKQDEFLFLKVLFLYHLT